MPAPPLSIRGVYDSLRPPTIRDLVFSLKAYFGAVAALLVGFSQNLENPYWAVLTIYIVLNPPESGAVRSKALFRFFGTIGGGTVMIVVTGLFGDQLGVLVAATIAIIAVATFMRQTDRTPANYLWFSGGVTAGVVGLTNLMQPTNVFDYATARMGEISLGILAITAADSLLWPRPMTPAFLQDVADWRAQARRWVTDALGPAAAQEPDDTRRQSIRQGLRDLAKEVGAIDAKAVQLPFDVVTMAPRGRQLNLLRRQIVALIADLVAIENWARALRPHGVLQGDLSGPVDGVMQWVNDAPEGRGLTMEAHVARGDALIQTLETAGTNIDPARPAVAYLERGFLHRLATFVRDWSDLSLVIAVLESRGRLPSRLDQMSRRTKPVRSVDYLGAALDVAPMVLSMTFTTVVWYVTAWSSGGGALLFSFIGCVFLIGQGAILRSSIGLVTWILTAFALVFFYQYAVLPRVTDFPVLMAVLGCAMLPFGLLMTMSMAGMLICVYMFSFLGLQSVYSGDFNTSLQTLSSSLAGLLIAVASLYVCSYDHGRFGTRRLVAAVRRDILDIARSRRVPDRERFLSLTVDRLSLYFPAAEQVAGGGPIARLRLIEDFAIGINLLTLREIETRVSAASREVLQRLRHATDDAFRRKLQKQPDDGPLRALVAAALTDPALLAEPEHERLLESLTGMGLALGDVDAPLPEDAERPR